MLVGKKVILSEIDPANIEWLRQQRNDPEMRQYFREWKDISKDMQEKWYKERGNNSNPNHIYFQIERTNKVMSAPNIIGCCGLHFIDWHLRSAEFGIFLSKNARGGGMGKEALELMFSFAFDQANIHKVWGEVYEFNNAIGLYTKSLGMTVDGKLRHNAFKNGKYYDSYMISILENEWRTRNKGE